MERQFFHVQDLWSCCGMVESRSIGTPLSLLKCRRPCRGPEAEVRRGSLSTTRLYSCGERALPGYMPDPASAGVTFLLPAVLFFYPSRLTLSFADALVLGVLFFICVCCAVRLGQDLQPLRPAPAQPSKVRDDVMLLQTPVRLRRRTGELLCYCCRGLCYGGDTLTEDVD